MSNRVFTEQLLGARLHIRYHLFHQGSGWGGPQACTLLAPPFLSHHPLSNAHSCAMWSVGHPGWDVGRWSPMMEAKSPARKESWDRIRYLGSEKEILGNSGEECAQNGHEMIKTGQWLS